MEKKPTVKDVAKQAGVSVATVSYIMNDRKDQKISEATRKKVLQIANLLNYHPSHAAKTLATGKTNIIGVAYMLDATRPSRNMEVTNFVNLLIERLNRMKYDVIFLSAEPESNHLPLNGNIDGIIAIDLPTDTFRHLADNYLVPIINVDMLVNDALFYQVYTDYAKKLKEAYTLLGEDAVLVLDKFSNESYTDYILQNSMGQVLFADLLTDKTLASLKEQKAIIIGNYLALLLTPYMSPENMLIISSEENMSFLPHGSHCLSIDSSKKANFSINILLNAIDRKFEVAHDYAI